MGISLFLGKELQLNCRMSVLIWMPKDMLELLKTLPQTKPIYKFLCQITGANHNQQDERICKTIQNYTFETSIIYTIVHVSTYA